MNTIEQLQSKIEEQDDAYSLLSLDAGRKMDELEQQLATLKAQPASGGDDAERADVASDAWLEKWAADKFTAYGQYKGRVYGNTDWALARSLHTAICAALPVREAVAEGWRLVPAEPSAEMEEAGCQGYMHADGNAWVMHKSSMGHAYKAMLAAAPSPSREGE